MAPFVGWFTVAGVVALLIATAATAVAGHQAGEREAIVDLRAKTLSVAQVRIQPVVTDSLLEGNITAVGEVSYAVRRHVIDDAVARVKIWNKYGTIVYSDESRLIGTHQPLRADQLAAISSARVRSKISDPSRPDNRFERAEGKLLEVDLRINAPNGQPLLLQVFYRYTAVSTAGTHVWNRFAPYALGALAALAVVLITTGCLLARRLGRRPEAPQPESVADEPVDEPDPGTEFVRALSHLVAGSNGGGIPSTLDTDVHNTIPPAIAELLFRATRETLRTHDDTTPVTVRVSDRDHVATLDVFENAGASHVDLRALIDLVADSGGRLVADAAADGATRVHVEVPLQ
ncbi:MAG: two-component system, NarL family, sensor kinase [Actinomycetota bacterium]|nr:two-component system, NarL family, sensor kinase [Actinomycetota bacterium]